MAMALVAGIALAIASIMTQLGRASKRTNVVSTAQQIKTNLSEMIANDSAWFQTLSDSANVNLKCLSGGLDCATFKDAVPEREFGVHDPTGAVFYDPRYPDAGYTETGASCKGYPSAACPFRVVLTWKANCPPAGASCMGPQIEVSGKVVYAQTDQRIAYNPENYSFKVVRSGLPAGWVGLTPPSPGPQGESASEPDGAAAPISVPEPAAAAPAGGTTDPAQALCGTIGAQLKDPSTLKQVKKQLQAMGYSESVADTYIENMQQTCKTQ